MSSSYCVKVAVSGVAYHFDTQYTYLLPDKLENSVVPGVRVEIPFGNGNRRRPALVLEKLNVTPDMEADKLKSVVTALDSSPMYDSQLLSLVFWLKEHTFCTLYEAASSLLPTGAAIREQCSYAVSASNCADADSLSGTQAQVYAYLLDKGCYVNRSRLLKDLQLEASCDAPECLVRSGLVVKNSEYVRRTGDMSVKNVRLCCGEDFFEDGGIDALSPKQRSVMLLLRDIGAASVKEVCYYTGVTAAVITALVKRGVAEVYNCEVFRRPKSGSASASGSGSTELSDEQTRAFNTLNTLLCSGNPGVSLLYGVTGSGKTQVFLKLVDEAISRNKGVIVMVPEISLTPQALSIFYERFGDKVAVFHSGLSAGERLDEFKRVKNGDAVIALGTRSAVFAPVKNLGLIVIDEEQEHTYKSEMSPRYHARDVAKYRCFTNNALLVLSSATPSVESCYNALNGKYTLVSLEERYGVSELPQVVTVDTSEIKSPISPQLYDKIEACISRGEQAILLINRRGYNTFASCTACKKVAVCPRCSISLTYHRRNNRLMCHYCGYSTEYTTQCPSCSQNTLRFAGTGTQKLEDELATVFPNARILRMDADTTSSRYSYEEKLTAFASGKYDILIGTQMIAKGLDFPLVTLVGVISVDRELYSDDFRSSEKTFDLLTQVVGRSGRRAAAGEAVIQSVLPDNEIIGYAASQDYRAFYDTEIAIRKMMLYPPFCDICTVTVSATSETLAFNGAKAFLDELKNAVQGEYNGLPLKILGPAPPAVNKINNRYRYRLIIKCRVNKQFREMISHGIITYKKNQKLQRTSLSVDINPLD